MQDLKPYIVPGIALLVLGLWFFVISPKLSPSDSKPSSATPSTAPSAPATEQ